MVYKGKQVYNLENKVDNPAEVVYNPLVRQIRVRIGKETYLMTGMTRYSRTTYLALCGLFAAIMAVCSFITIPLGFTPVPINLGTLGVFLAGGILGKKYGTVSIAVYVLLGAIGIPVFAGFKGGLGVLAGPTGGYIIGYIVAAFIIGLIIETFEKGSAGETGGNAGFKGFAGIVVALIIGLLACYALGTLWFILSTGTGVWASLLACVFPFLPGDGIKIVVATILIRKLRQIL